MISDLLKGSTASLKLSNRNRRSRDPNSEDESDSKKSKLQIEEPELHTTSETEESSEKVLNGSNAKSLADSNSSSMSDDYMDILRAFGCISSNISCAKTANEKLNSATVDHTKQALTTSD